MVKNSIFSILLGPDLKKAIGRSIFVQNEPLMVHFKEFICVIFNYLSIKVVVKLYFAINFAPLSLF